MKKSSILIPLTLILILSACSTSNNKLILGAERYGKNKLVKTEQSDNDDSTTGNINNKKSDHNTILSKSTIAHLDHQNDSLNIFDQHTFENVKVEDSSKLSDQINRIQNEIENTGNSITHNPGRNKHPFSTETDDSGSLILLILLIVLGSILLVGLLFYLIILLIAKAADEAVDDACYVATMTYGSYDHPKVKTLRVFRDEFLAKRKWGVAFIQWYYRNSPALVQRFKNNQLVNGFFRVNLNVFVFFLRRFLK